MTELQQLARTPEANLGLEALLQRELELLDGLQALLTGEREALLRRDAAEIAAYASRKRAALQHLAGASEQTRAAWTIQRRAGAGASAASPHAQALFHSVRSRWAQAQRENLRNGAVLKIHQASVLRGLGVLRQSVGGFDLYRADGRTGGHYLSA